MTRTRHKHLLDDKEVERDEGNRESACEGKGISGRYA